MEYSVAVLILTLILIVPSFHSKPVSLYYLGIVLLREDNPHSRINH